jgi:protocatechuate 3,4-dioxygenase beta subunit
VDGVHARTGVKIVVETGAVVRGTVKDGKGAPVASADVRVVVRGAEFLRARRDAFTAADGTFTIRGLPRRAVDVVASHESGASAIVPADLAAKVEVEVALTLDVTGAIEGTVVDSAGVAIGDAQVSAEPVWSGGTTDREAWSVRGSHDTVTDQGGAFRFAGLPDGQYKIRAARPGGSWAELSLAAVTLAKPNGPKLKIIVPGDGQVTGKVAFADGKVPASFTVALGNTDPRPFATKDGTFTVPAVAGTHTLVVDGRGFLASKAKEVTIVEGKTADAGTIVVTPGRSISGRVLDSAGMPVAKATVAAGKLLSGGGAELYIENESVGAKSTETDADGRFSIDGFPPYAITIIAGKADLGRSPSLRLPASPDSANLDLVLQKTTGLEGTVTRDGKPLGDTVIIANPYGASSSNFFVTTGPDGTFALDALAPGAYVVYPMIGGGGNRPKDMYIIKVTLTLGVRTKVTIDASPGPVTVAINVKTTGGTKVPMAQLFMLQATINPDSVSALRGIDQLDVFGDKPIPMHMRAAMGGTGEVTGVRPGQYTVCAIPVFGPPPDDPDAMSIKCTAAKIGAGPKATIDIVVPEPKP